MTDSKLLQEIAEKAADYTRTHSSEVSRHELKAMVLIAFNDNVRYHYDDKQHTPHNIALAYGMGYRDALHEVYGDLPTISGRPYVERLRDLLEARPNEGVIAAIERWKKERADEKRAIRKALGRTSEVVGTLADDVAAVVKERDEGHERTNLAVERLKILRTHIDVGVRPFVNAEKLRADLTKLVEETIARLTEQPEQANIGIVKKPPPPPPAAPPKPEEISDELAQAAADYSNRIGNLVPAHDDVHRARKLATYASESASWEASIQDFIAGVRWQRNEDGVLTKQAQRIVELEKACANGAESIERASTRIEELESQVERIEAERLAMKEDRDRALDKVRTWEARTGETQPRIVESKLSTREALERIRAKAQTIEIKFVGGDGVRRDHTAKGAIKDFVAIVDAELTLLANSAEHFRR
jgi:hypothetical protein